MIRRYVERMLAAFLVAVVLIALTGVVHAAPAGGACQRVTVGGTVISVQRVNRLTREVAVRLDDRGIAAVRTLRRFALGQRVTATGCRDLTGDLLQARIY